MKRGLNTLHSGEIGCWARLLLLAQDDAHRGSKALGGPVLVPPVLGGDFTADSPPRATGRAQARRAAAAGAIGVDVDAMLMGMPMG